MIDTLHPGAKRLTLLCHNNIPLPHFLAEAYDYEVVVLVCVPGHTCIILSMYHCTPAYFEKPELV